MEVCTSGVGGGGEGLFAKRQLEEGELVAIYNGVKVPIVAGAGKEDWEECGYSIGYYETSNSEHGWGDMDIPKAFRSSDSYRLFLAFLALYVTLLQGHTVPQAEPQFPKQLSILGHPAPRLWLPTMCSHYKKGQLDALANLNFYPHSRLRQVVNCLSIINTSYQTALSGTKNYTTNCEPITSVIKW